MKDIIGNLSHNNIWIRTGYAYLIFFILLAASFTFGFLFMPEGIMKEIPFPSLLAFEKMDSFLSLFVKTTVFNSFALILIIAANHIRVRSFNFGYLLLFANTVIMGLFAGTNSFSGTTSAYSLKGLWLFLQIGFLEFSAYIIACAATVNLAMYHAEKWYYGKNWYGEKFKKIRSFWEFPLSKLDIIFLLIAFVLLVFAAFNEWNLK